MATYVEDNNTRTYWNEEKDMRVFLATWLEDNQGEALSKANYRNRLMSYFFLKEAKPRFLPVYVLNGKVLRRKDRENKNK